MVGQKFDNSKCVIKVIKQLTFCAGIMSANFEGGGSRLVLTMLTQGGGQNLGKLNDNAGVNILHNHD